MVTVATWNVNSIKSRLTHLLDWLRADKPDIVLLQELKCTNENFPAIEIEDLGYNLAVHGEKTYNGVAILSKFPLDDIKKGLSGDDTDIQSRYIEAVINLQNTAIRVASVYVPNGQTTDSEKYQYKLRFLERFKEHCKKLLSYEEMLVIGGDYNIAPTDADVHNPKAWQGSVLTHDDVRAAWRRIEHLGLYNAFKLPINHQPSTTNYSWWDYRAGAFERDDGLLIDHLLLSPQAADKAQSCTINKHLRALEKPSDHTPVIVTLAV
ncbi:MAG: exodeoxyribonuclease III [Alphaproteobacteria bacterium]